MADARSVKLKRQAVSVVIPTFNGQALLAKNLGSVLGCLNDGDEVIIVDDASQDLTVEWLVKQYHLKPESSADNVNLYRGKLSSARVTIEILVVAQAENRRFGASSNQGVKLATRPLVFVLNNDVKPQPDVLDFLAAHFQDPQKFGVGCLELEGVTKASQVEAFREKGQLQDLTLGGKNRLWFSRGLFQHARAEDFASGPTGWVSGGSGLFDREKWLELGGFDPRYYPAYWEDIDLSERARRRGWQVWFESQAVVEHHHETTHRAVFKQYQLVRQGWWHSVLFTWRFGNIVQRLQMLFWLPYYLFKLRKALLAK